VDDEPINLMLLEANLKKKYSVLTATSGKSGLDILNDNEDIKVVMSDMKMPKMSGLEFIKRAHQHFHHIVFYVLTGFEVTNEIQEALNSGLIRGYFRKPFNMNDISGEMDIVFKDT
jgi:response regulator RpfG family c-di-GMP phosphodiesterase